MSIKEIGIAVHSTDNLLAGAVMRCAYPRRGDEIAVGDDLRIQYEGAEENRQIDPEQVLLFMMSFPVGVTASMAAYWICKHFFEGRDVSKVRLSSVDGYELVEYVEFTEETTIESMDAIITTVVRMTSQKKSPSQ